jgi:DNA-binding GntR family transcriptional regulator
MISAVNRLLQLERERLVEGRVNKPSVVRRPAAEEIFQVYTIRAALEGLSARWAAERATPEMILDLRTRAEELNKTTKSKKEATAELLRQAFDFHAAIATASGSEDLQYVLRNLRNQIRAVMAAGLASLTERRAEEIHDEHLALRSAIAESDGDLAQQLAAEHVQSARDRIVHSD